jgi:SAM-dependent methyltransferase
LSQLRLFGVETGSFLEIGCGTGYVLAAISNAFPQLQMTGSELLPEAFEFARNRISNAAFIALNAKELSNEFRYDYVGAFDVLEHIDDDELALTNIFEALEPGGIFFITVPQHQWLWSKSDEYWFHCRRYEPGQMESKLVKVGFEVLNSTSFISILLPLMVLARFFQKSETNNFDPFKQLKMPGLISMLFDILLKLELVLITHGWKLPVGGSRLIVAKRLS